MDEALQRFRQAAVQEAFVFLVPAGSETEAVEQQLGFRFPPSYKVFLERRDGIPTDDIVERNRLARQTDSAMYLPEFLVAFFDDGMGNQYCFDTRARSEDGECAIVFWDHELPTEEKLAKLSTTDRSFAVWLARCAAEIPDAGTGGLGVKVGCAIFLMLVGLLFFFAGLGAKAFLRWFE